MKFFSYRTESEEPPKVEKPPLDRLTQADIIDLVLWAGQLMMQNGADTQRIEETCHRLGTGLGCDWMDILVSHSAIIATSVSAGDFRTKLRRVPRIGVNMSVVAQVNDLPYRVEHGELDRTSARTELERIARLGNLYNRWLVVFMVGLSCAAFARLFEGDIYAILVTFVASSIAMIIRQELQKLHFNYLLITATTAFVAGFIASMSEIIKIGETPEASLAACVLLLVPGVPLINSVEDLIKGHITTGISRGMMGILISAAIALGLTLAMALTGARW
jgi:uncharacterized membrane protein YjjP (DUF1212 family)